MLHRWRYFKPAPRWSHKYTIRDILSLNGANFSEEDALIVGLRPPPPPVVPTFFLLVSFSFLFEDFYYIVWKNIRKSVFVAVQDSCNYAGTKLCLNDHYLCETFCLGWTLHHCNTTPMWGLISLLVLIEHLSQLAWMPTYGTAIRDFRHQRAVYLESLLWHEFSSNCSLPSRCHFKDNVWTPVMPSFTAGPGWANNQWTASHDSLYHMTLIS